MMKPKFEAVLDMCLDNGLRRGYNRAFKHDDNPTEQVILENQHNAILDEIHEWFDMDMKDAY